MAVPSLKGLDMKTGCTDNICFLLFFDTYLAPKMIPNDDRTWLYIQIRENFNHEIHTMTNYLFEPSMFLSSLPKNRGAFWLEGIHQPFADKLPSPRLRMPWWPCGAMWRNDDKRPCKCARRPRSCGGSCKVPRRIWGSGGSGGENIMEICVKLLQ